MRRLLTITGYMILCCMVSLDAQISVIASESTGCDSISATVYLDPPGSYDTIQSLSWNLNGSMIGTLSDTLQLRIETPGEYQLYALINGKHRIWFKPGFKVYETVRAAFTAWPASTGNQLSYVFRSNYQNRQISVDYNWRINGESAGNEPVLEWTFPNSGSFQVSLEAVNNHGCVSSFNKLVLAGEDLSCPNVFSPNWDGYNDFFEVETDGMTVYLFQVYSRAGIKVFQSESPAIFWDGRSLSGLEMQPGIYYYLIEPVNGDKPEKISGFVHLYR